MPKTAEIRLRKRLDECSTLVSSSRRLRVLHLGKFYHPYRGGIETYLKNLCEQLCARGIEVGVVVSNTGAREVEDDVNGVKVRRLSTPFKLASAPLSRGLVRAIRESNADIVHLHTPNPLALLAYWRSGHHRRGGKLVITHHSDVIKQKFLYAVFKPFEDEVFKRCDAVIATSLNYVESSAILSKYQSKCHIIPFGIDLSRFDEIDEGKSAAIRARYGSRIIVSIGRLVYYKGFEYLIRAMCEVEAQLLIIGEGHLRAELERLARALGVAERVHLLGEVSDVIPYLRAADVFALASTERSEAFGIVQLEAMACGTPVVNTNLKSGVPFVSRDGETGLTVPPGDAKALAEALNRLLADELLRARFGYAARRRVEEELTLERMVEQTIGVYESVIMKRRTGSR